MKKLLIFIVVAVSLCGCNSHKVYDSSLEEVSSWVRKCSNVDEGNANIYKRLDILKSPSGEKIESALQWNELSKQVKDFFATSVYGKPLPRPQKLEFKLLESGEFKELNAIRKQYKVLATNNGKVFEFGVLIYIPKNAKNVPVFVSPNFTGNHTVWLDEKIILPNTYLRINKRVGIEDNRPSEQQRGKASWRHPMDKILSRGYAFATFCYCEVFPDHFQGAKDSVYQIYPPRAKGTAIPAWAWGNSRVLDLIETLPEIDSQKAIVVGHSRLGKTAIYTGVFDARFAITISNNSGCLGAATNRRNFGESILHMAKSKGLNFWFVDELKKFGGKGVEDMPFDQSHLLACVAPRGLYVASATADIWADPLGEYQSFKDASKIYALYGAKNLPSESDKLYVQKQFLGDIGHHLRIGKHDIVEYDWSNFMDYADTFFKLD
ncbi:MAG: hypothetical protein J6B07_02390 [Opitutales bacterium]|nr:hypothetical protein [Opitutales bacterium]